VAVYPRLNLSTAITDMYSGYDSMANLLIDRLQFSLSFRRFLPEPHAKSLVQLRLKRKSTTHWISSCGILHFP